MASYNHGNFVLKAVHDLLHQSYNTLEIIIVNDCSTDDTSALIREHFSSQLRCGGIKLLENERNLGQLVSRDRGAAAANGEILLFADSDERYTPHHIALMLSHIEAGADCVNQHTSVRIDENGTIIERRRKGFPGSLQFKLMIFGLTGSDIMMRRAVFEQLGGFAPLTIKYGEDWAFLLEVFCRGFTLTLTETHTTLHREHDNTLTCGFDWHSYRQETLQPHMKHKWEAGAISTHHYAIFIFGGCFNAPIVTVPLIILKALRYSPFLFVREPAGLIYLGWNLQRRTRFVFKKFSLRPQSETV